MSPLIPDATFHHATADGLAANPTLDRLARLVSRFLGAPIAAVSLVDANAQHFVGFEAPDGWNDGRRSTPLTHAFCRHVVERRDALIVEDALADPLVADNGAVRDLHVRAYIGVPLLTRDGVALGACCAMDLTARPWSADAQSILEDLAALAMAELDRSSVESRLAAALDAVADGMWEWDMATGRGFVSDRWNVLHGRPPQAPAPTAKEFAAFIHPEDQPRVQAALEAHTQGLAPEYRAEFRTAHSGGRWRWMLGRGRIVARSVDGTPLRMLGTQTDITAMRELEERLRHAQKLEAVGQLAGGVAHDFNNLLTVIGGGVYFAMDAARTMPSVPEALTDALEDIRAASARAASLTRQLLTFSRKQHVVARDVSLMPVLRDTERLLGRLLPEEVRLICTVAADDLMVRADPGQLEQVLLNLAVNARDALLSARHGHPGTGGTVRVSLDAVGVPDPSESERATDDALKPGRYARLRVSDDGHGMDGPTRERMFDPFFTTKDEGRGTGLGLATVYGIVQSLEGSIHVDSAPGAGTRVTVLLPTTTPSDSASTTSVASSDIPLASRVLLVEDEASVRRTVRQLLERFGCTVVEAVDGADAWERWPALRDQVDVVLTDVRMPHLGGLDLARQLRADRADVPIVFMTGHAERLVELDDWPHAALLPKPFVSEELEAALRIARRS